MVVVPVVVEVRCATRCESFVPLMHANTAATGAGATRHRAADDRHAKNIAPYVSALCPQNHHYCLVQSLTMNTADPRSKPPRPGVPPTVMPS